jgi:hypothetical protein
MGRLDRPERKFIKGNTHEANMTSIEKALTRLDRHVSKNIDVLIPPTPISVYIKEVTEDGDLFRFMSPFDATLRSVVFTVERIIGKEKSIPVYIDIVTASNNAKSTYTLTVTAGTKQSDIGLDIKAGDKVIVRSVCGDGELTPKAEDIWLALMMDLKIDSMRVMRLAMDEIIVAETYADADAEEEESERI